VPTIIDRKQGQYKIIEHMAFNYSDKLNGHTVSIEEEQMKHETATARDIRMPSH
jgi:hypothetical protein